ncbi:MAG: mercury transporter MerT [Deltaproteobacteria bacterium]|nr:MAG: mercury transporter MerT [Deltaproteobacteria bacterium]
MSQKTSRRAVGAAVAAAVAASICCLGPVVLLALGISGAWIGNLTALEPVRPLFILLTGAFLGYAYARIFRERPEPEACAPGSACASPRYRRFEGIGFVAVVLVVASLLMAPEILGRRASNHDGAGAPRASAPVAAGFAPSAEPTTARVVLSVENMTCQGCLHTVRTALEALPGVEGVEVRLSPPQAVVTYDPSRVSVSQLVEATTEAGYPSRPTS